MNRSNKLSEINRNSFPFKILNQDPRHYQILVLFSLFLYGKFWLDFEVESSQVITILLSALSTQYFFTRHLKHPKFDPRSPLISGLSLCLLLRTSSLPMAFLSAVITISSKFILRWNNKNIFNPTNFGLVVMLILSDQVWVSPGQWGSTAFIGFLIACVGGLVVNRASRSDVTYAFFFFYVASLFGRALWLGDPISIPLHQFQNGAFLIFAFFMISDPKTTPDSRAGRIIFAFLVAIGSYVAHFVLYMTNGLLWSLTIFALFVPLIDLLIKGEHFEWKKIKTFPLLNKQEVHP